MAQIVTVKILVNESDLDTGEIKAKALLAKLFKDHSVVDGSIEDVAHANSAINESIKKATYSEGDFVQQWAIHSPMKGKFSESEGFWSSEYGWNAKELANIYDGSAADLPDGYAAMPDAEFVMVNK